MSKSNRWVLQNSILRNFNIISLESCLLDAYIAHNFVNDVARIQNVITTIINKYLNRSINNNHITLKPNDKLSLDVSILFITVDVSCLLKNKMLFIHFFLYSCICSIAYCTQFTAYGYTSTVL